MGLAGGQHEKRLEIYFLETIHFTFFSEELMARTDYDLVNSAIIKPYFSMAKAPYGFPLMRPNGGWRAW
jgi:hypothetical protein